MRKNILKEHIGVSWKVRSWVNFHMKNRLKKNLNVKLLMLTLMSYNQQLQVVQRHRVKGMYLLILLLVGWDLYKSYFFSLITPSGLSTNASAGLETPDMIELRKKKIETDMEDNETPVLYKVLPEKPVSVGGSMMGSSKVYDLSNAKKVTAEGMDMDIALNPDELDLDADALQARYNQQLKEQQNVGEKEDLGDMVSDHAAKQNKKRKKQQQETQSNVKEDKDKSAKKKEFKF
jgi:hypothetical protein